MSDRITVSLGVTKNLGNFESLRLDATYETDVAVGESVDDAYTRAWSVVDDQVNGQIPEDE